MVYVSLLRKRPDAKTPCDADLQDDDTRFQLEVMKRTGCIPVYWKPNVSIDESFKSCNTSEEMAEIFSYMKDKEGTMVFYKQPCDYMKVAVVATQKKIDSESLEIELVYMDKKYQEFVNKFQFPLKGNLGTIDIRLECYQCWYAAS